MKQYEMIQVEKVEDSALKITLNRPNKANALNDKMMAELDKVVSEIRHNSKVKFVIFTGSGSKHFSGGADMKEFMEKMDGDSSDSSWVRNFQVELQEFHKRLESLDQVTIAAVNGAMYGGGLALALACDFRVIASEAETCVPEVDRGMFFAAGSIPRLVSLVGPSKAKELVMFAGAIDAEEALDIGLANKVVPNESLLPSVYEMVEKLASKHFMPLRLTKKITNTYTRLLSSGSVWEPELFEHSLQQGALDDGVGSFVNRKN